MTAEKLYYCPACGAYVIPLVCGDYGTCPQCAAEMALPWQQNDCSVAPSGIYEPVPGSTMLRRLPDDVSADAADEADEADALTTISVLDHGFVRLVGWLGNDEAIARAARVSYGQSTKTPEQDRRLIARLMKDRHCYDEETEVLTRRGFVRWPDVTPDDLLGTWDDAAQTLTYERPSALHAHDYDGEMYGIRHAAVDLLVTPEHRMWISRRSKKQWQPFSLVPTDDIALASMVRYCKVAPLRDAAMPELPSFLQDAAHLPDFAAFLGFFVGDGHAETVNSAAFNLRKTRKRDYLTSLCLRLGWSVTDGPSMRVTVRGLGACLLQQCYTEAGDKQLPDPFIYAPQAITCGVIDGLRQSDGSEKRGTWTFDTASPALAAQFPVVALHAGLAVSERRQDTMYRFAILSRSTHPVMNQGTINECFPMYRGKVYCATVRSGVLVVRRNGKIVLSGNSSPFEHVVFTLHVKAPLFVARQWMRHRTWSYSELSQRYAEAPDEFYQPSAETIWTQHKTNKQASGTVLDTYAAETAQALYDGAYALAYERYTRLLSLGVSREQARIVLPVGVYTQFYGTVDLHNLFHFLRLRLAADAQYEIRVYAEAIAALIEPIVPAAYAAFKESLT